MKCVQYNEETLKEAIQILKDGGVVAHPTDTCFGLTADPMNPEAVDRIQEIKGRYKIKPMSIMLPVFMKLDINDYAVTDDFSLPIFNKLLPGPVTVLLPKGPKIPEYFFPEAKYVGIRIPYEIMTQDILMKFKGPLITTSANLSHEPPCATCEEVVDVFKNKENKPDLIFDGAVKNACIPSTVILVKDGKLEIRREGPMNKKQLEGILGINIH